jgi:hypothetical protein
MPRRVPDQTQCLAAFDIKMITVASIVFVAAFLLWLAQDRVLRSAYCKRRVGPQSLLRSELVGGGALLAIVGGSFFFLCVGMFLQGKIEGVWIPVVARSDHPFWFWTLTVFSLLSAIGVTCWGISDVIQGMKTRSRE